MTDLHQAAGVVAHARELGVHLWAQGGALHYRSPRPLPDELAALLKAWKGPVLDFLTDSALEAFCSGLLPSEALGLREERAAILEHEAGLTRAEAERRAGLRTLEDA